MDIGDIDDDGDDDIVLATLTPDGGQTYVEVFKAQIQARKQIKRSSSPLRLMAITATLSWVNGGGSSRRPFTGQTLPGECEDLDLWVLRTPRFNPEQVTPWATTTT